MARRDDYDSEPIKPPRVFREINAFYEPDTYFVTAIGTYQIWSGQFQQVHKPRHYQVCGQAGPLGWEIPAAIGVKCAVPDAEVVGVVGDYSFQFLVEELAVAAQYDIGFVLVMLNNHFGHISDFKQFGHRLFLTLVKMAGHPTVSPIFVIGWYLLSTNVHHLRAARVENTTRRQFEQRRRDPRNPVKFAFGIQPRQTFDQHPGIGMKWVGK
jgi:TPP-dependent trihydroxycyclohexane-1,2-dione (THcHDO) dehydratase